MKLIKTVALAFSFAFSSLVAAPAAQACDKPDCACKGGEKACDHKDCNEKDCPHKGHKKGDKQGDKKADKKAEDKK